MSRPRPDFVQVRLSAAGRTLAGEGVVRISSAHLRYQFAGEKPVEVLRRGDWPMLRNECNAEGELLFELAEEPTPQGAS